MVEELNVPQRSFSPKEDYRVDPLKRWSEQVGAHSRRVEDVHIISSADYLRFTAWTLDRDVSRRKQDHSYGYYSLIRDQGIGRRKLAKALKKAAADLASAEYSDSGHQDIVMMLAGDSLMVRPVSYLAIGNMQLSGTMAPESVLVHSLDTRAIVSHPTRAALAEFELMLNSSTAVEADYQELFENNPSLLLGTDYERLVSQPLLVREDEENLIPDFVLVPYGHTSPKILDLKRPDVPIYRGDRNRQGFLASVLKARDQLLEYRSYFNSREVVMRMSASLGVDLYLPKIAVVIGRSSDFPSQFERRKAESRLPDIEVLTYDDVLAKAQRVAESYAVLM